MNLCPLCKENHDKNHNIIKYNEKNYKCEIHLKGYNSYCLQCEKNICILCEKQHNEHEIIRQNNTKYR